MFNSIFFNKSNKIYNFASGRVLPLSEVGDDVFSQQIMGDGYAIELDNGRVVSPVAGKVVMVFPTGHAFGIRTKSGVEILIHLGIDTVELNGEGFQTKVAVGDSVKPGTLLSVLNLDFIRLKGKSLISPLVFTSGEKIILHKGHELVTESTEDIFEFIK